MFVAKCVDSLIFYRRKSEMKKKSERISFWSVMVKAIKEGWKSYRISIQKELEKKALLSSRSDWSMLESLVKKCNENQNLRITVYLNDGTRIDMKTYEKERSITSALIDGNEYYEEIK